MIIGIGVDACPVERMRAALERRPGLADRLFRPGEQLKNGRPRQAESMAARFAAKEALIKAMGSAGTWLDAEVINDEVGKPGFQLHNDVARRAESLGIEKIHLAISHDGGMAIAMVVCEGNR